MSDSPIFGGDMFRNMLGDLLRLMPAPAGVPWELAYQLAGQIAAGDAAEVGPGTEANPDPLQRIRFEELSAIAELHVTEVTGLSAGGGSGARIVPVTRADWARRAIDTWRPVLDRLAAILTPPAPPPVAPADASAGDEDGNQMLSLLNQWAAAMFPTMTAMQIGSVAGHLAEAALFQYEIPLAPVASNDLYVVSANIDATASDWGLPVDDLRLWVSAHEITYHAVLSRPVVATRIADLVVAHTELVKPNAEAVGELLSNADPGDMAALERLFGDPSALAQPGSSEELDRVRGDLEAITAAVAGYVEHVTRTIATRLIGNHAPIGEVMRRKRVTRGDGERVAEALFGLSLDQGLLDRGERFVEGVLERSGELQLAKMWTDASYLPTPAEVDAPGLWLARLEFTNTGD